MSRIYSKWLQNDTIKLRTDFFLFATRGFPTLFVKGFYDLVPAEKTCQSWCCNLPLWCWTGQQDYRLEFLNIFCLRLTAPLYISFWKIYSIHFVLRATTLTLVNPIISHSIFCVLYETNICNWRMSELVKQIFLLRKFFYSTKLRKLLRFHSFQLVTQIFFDEYLYKSETTEEPWHYLHSK